MGRLSIHKIAHAKFLLRFGLGAFMLGPSKLGADMVYTVKEIRGMIAGLPLPDVAKGSGVAHSTLWRLLAGKQEAREGTLAKLTDYIDRRVSV